VHCIQTSNRDQEDHREKNLEKDCIVMPIKYIYLVYKVVEAALGKLSPISMALCSFS
jgi:hypothetical protein